MNYKWLGKPYKKLERVFHQVSKHLKVGLKKLGPAWFFSTHFSVFGYPDETLLLVVDILLIQSINSKRKENKFVRFRYACYFVAVIPNEHKIRGTDYKYQAKSLSQANYEDFRIFRPCQRFSIFSQCQLHIA